MAEFPGAKDRFVDKSRVWTDQNDHATIVIHGTGGNPNQTADQLGDFFETTPAVTSVHYGIDRAGNIDQYVLEKDGAGGNGILDPGHDSFWNQYADNPNWHSLSVETENDLTNSLPLTEPQKGTLFGLVGYWVKKYNIPPSNIKGHFSLQPINRVNCPGPNFPWSDLFTYLQGGNIPMTQIPTGWGDDGTALKGPNGVPVALGFRDYVLKNNWNKDNWPLEPEQHCDPLEQSNTSLGAGQRQRFRWITLEYTAKMGVFEAWTGPELLWYQQQLAQLTKEIAALKNNIGASNLQQINALAKQFVALSGQLDTLSKGG